MKYRNRHRLSDFCEKFHDDIPRQSQSQFISRQPLWREISIFLNQCHNANQSQLSPRSSGRAMWRNGRVPPPRASSFVAAVFMRGAPLTVILIYIGAAAADAPKTKSRGEERRRRRARVAGYRWRSLPHSLSQPSLQIHSALHCVSSFYFSTPGCFIRSDLTRSVGLPFQNGQCSRQICKVMRFSMTKQTHDVKAI